MIPRRGLLVLALFAPCVRRASAGSEESSAGPPLSAAQRALFETPHLEALRPPVRLDYAFRRSEEGKDPVEDAIRLEVRASEDEGRRDVAPEFLTGPRQIRYPPARGFRGNPLLLFALDRDTRELSAATGGSATWFRNRIRRALAEGAEVRPARIALGGRDLAATEIVVAPFAEEPRAGRYRARIYRFVLSPEVPGWIAAIRTEVPAGPEGGAITEAIVFAAAVPLPEAGR